MRDVLVELPGGEGVVRADDGRIVVTDDIRGAGGRALREEDRYRPITLWLAASRTLVGGLVAPGAVSVEVTDDRGARIPATIGGGAYAAVLGQPFDGSEAAVCCRDATGSPVRRPLAVAYPCAPVLDSKEPCPACGAIDYEECRPSEPWRGGRGGPEGRAIPSPIVVCRRCGHEESQGGIIRLISRDDEPEEARAARIARARAERRVQGWYRNKITLLAVTFPIYAAEGWPVQISGSGSHGDEVTQLTIAHTDDEDAELNEEPPRIEVTTSTDPFHEREADVARRACEHSVDLDDPRDGGMPDGSDAAISLWFSATARRRRAAALTAPRSSADITIDGAPRPFLILTGPGNRWVAIRRHHDVVVTVAARDVNPASISLEPIGDPAARLQRPEPDEP